MVITMRTSFPVCVWLVLLTLMPAMSDAQVTDSMREELAGYRRSSHTWTLDQKRELLTMFEGKTAEAGTDLAEMASNQLENIRFLEEIISSIGLPLSETAEVQKKLNTMADWYQEGERVSKLLQPDDVIRTSYQDMDESIITEYSGSGPLKTRPFTVGGPWEIQWNLESSDDMAMINISIFNEDGFPVDTALQMQAGKSSSYQSKGGTYYLDITALGNWEVKVVRVRD